MQDLTLPYTESDWENDCYSLFVERGDPRPCPVCGRTGFFGPRAADRGRKYRACRFCGFSQDVGEEPAQLRAAVHWCEEWPECARAQYVWWVPADEQTFTCPYCRRRAPVESRNAFVRAVGVQKPSDDPAHPWHRVPQQCSYAYYLRFWENWRCTKGRVVL